MTTDRDPSQRLLYRGTWVDLRARKFVNAAGESRDWEYFSRRKAAGAVAVIAVTESPHPTIVLVEQFRPPLDARILEFPAGLVEPGHDPTESALRELEEETGCQGTVTSIGPPVFESPGLSDASVALVTVKITSRHPPRHEPDEDIRVVELPLRSLAASLRAQAAAGLLVDAKLWWYAAGREAVGV